MIILQREICNPITQDFSRRNKSMQEVIQFLQENPVQYLATVGRDGRAKCRPFMFSGELDGKLWFCTDHTKEVY